MNQETWVQLQERRRAEAARQDAAEPQADIEVVSNLRQPTINLARRKAKSNLISTTVLVVIIVIYLIKYSE
jgi:hypothetical protein